MFEKSTKRNAVADCLEVVFPSESQWIRAKRKRRNFRWTATSSAVAEGGNYGSQRNLNTTLWRSL